MTRDDSGSKRQSQAGAAIDLEQSIHRAREAYGSGRLSEAGALCRAVLDASPSQPDAAALLGVIALRERDFGAAEAHLREALRSRPRIAEFRYNLGLALGGQGRSAASAEQFRETVALDPSFTAAWVNLGQILQQSHRFDEAEVAYTAALRGNPAMPKVQYNLGNVLSCQQRETEAIERFRAAIAIDPGYARAHLALVRDLRKLSFYEGAASAARGAIAECPDSSEAHGALGLLLMEQGLLDEALAALRHAVELQPDSGNHSVLIWALCCHPDYDAAAIHREARRWESRFAKPLYAESSDPSNDASPERRLKIAYLSPDFKRHPVGFFLAPVIREHDREVFEVLCFSGVSEPDDLTDRIMGYADEWRDMRDLDDAALAAFVRDARIDIVVDLAGHSRGNRLLTLARRAAPVQVCAGGHYCTTGVGAVDYLVSDRHQTPPGSDGDFSERLLRLPDGYVCYEPPDYAPPVTETPALERGVVTFCCYNSLHKITSRVLDLWAATMKAVPGSRLRMQTGALNDPVTRDRFRNLLVVRGVDGDRVELRGPVSHGELLNNYGLADIALDPFPYSGGLTTCESLWMGVPVVTLIGTTFAGRHTTSHLHNMGLSELVANTEDDYVGTAARLAGDVERLASMRRALRPRMAASPLCDGVRYTRNLERAIREAWRTWCASR